MPAIFEQAYDEQVFEQGLAAGGRRWRNEKGQDMHEEVAHEPLRLTRRGRMVLLVLCTLLCGLFAMLVPGLLSAATADSPSVPTRVEVVTIDRGQTLWHVASEMTASGADVRDAVDVLVELNNLPSVDVQVGQQLLVPIA